MTNTAAQGAAIHPALEVWILAQILFAFGEPTRSSRHPMFGVLPNALVQLQAHYHHCGEAASEKCLAAATFVRQRLTNLYALVARSALLRNDRQCPKRVNFLASRTVNRGIGKDR